MNSEKDMEKQTKDINEKPDETGGIMVQGHIKIFDPETKETPQAAAVLSGGKTMTGVPRDTIEIDPMMKTKKQAIFGSQKTIK